MLGFIKTNKAEWKLLDQLWIEKEQKEQKIL